jgi:hypothetical protein
MLAAGEDEPVSDNSCIQSGNQDRLVPRRFSVGQGQHASWAPENLGEELKEHFIGSVNDWRRRHFDLQFIPERFADRIPRGTRLHLHCKQDAIFLLFQERHGPWTVER